MQGTSLWSSVAGHRETLARLSGAVSQKQVAHAYLFAGPDGIGKRFIATIFAAALNCESSPSPCGGCSSCRAILRHIHPDIYYIEAEGNFIMIGQIREVQRFVQLKNILARHKVVVIDQADAMTLPAANCLLKILEEPPGATVFTLIAASLESLPPTVISRCQLVSFKPLAATEIENFLTDKFDLTIESARAIAFLSRGSVADAIVLAKDDYRLRRREKILSLVSKIKKAEPFKLTESASELIHEVGEEIAALKERQQAEYKELKEIIEDPAHQERQKKQMAKRHKRELTRLERKAYDDILSCLKSYYRDVLLIVSGGNQNLAANIDLVDKLTDLVGDFNVAAGLKAVSYIEEARTRLFSNVSPALTLETLFYKLQEI